MNSRLDTFFGFPPYPDPVTKQLPLLKSQWPINIILGAYLLFVLKLGRKFMEHRQPYNLNKVMNVYNLFQVLYNSIVFALATHFIIIRPRYDFRCMANLSYEHPDKNIERAMCYAYFINKLIDLLDTVFFVLRKSYKQITFLHVSHHVLMSYALYWSIQYFGIAGQAITVGYFNAGVHAIMYFYYFISSMYPELKGSIWWKKYITILQITQFVILLIQSLLILLFYHDCKVSFLQHVFQVLICTSMITMFGKFYYMAYIKPRPQKPLKRD